MSEELSDVCGYSLVVERGIANADIGVRFPLPAQNIKVKEKLNANKI